MAYYNDYSTVVPYKSSDTITNSVVSNVMANLFVARAGATLITSANESTSSSSTNYAEIQWHDLYIKFYGPSSLGNLVIIASYSSGGNGITYLNFSFAVSSGISCTVRLRFFNAASGFLCWYFNNGWYFLLAGLVSKKISDDTLRYFICTAYPSDGSNLYCADGLITYGQYYILGFTYGGPCDIDGIRQELSKVHIAVSSSSPATSRYYCDDVFCSVTYINTGTVVQIGTDYYHIPSSGKCAIKLKDI